MRITLSSKAASTDVVVLPVFDDRKIGPGADSVPDLDLSAALAATPSFRGGVDDTPLVIVPSARNTPTVVLVGLGSRRAAGAREVRVAALRAASGIRGRRRVTTTLGQVGDDRAASVRAAIEGFLLGAYRSPRPDAAPRPGYEEPPNSLACLLDADDARRADVREALERGRVTGERADWVRTLTEMPSGHLTPSLLADAIAADAAEAGYEMRVWDAAELAKHGFGGLLSVSRGSVEPPRLVELRYGDQSRPLGLVGKGLTFDAGGINLKKFGSEIHYMKCDMASAAAVAGAVSAAARLGLDVGVRALLPLTENMPSGSATRPGDVIVHPNGLTTEVADTDCEGRLVLADGIAFLVGEGVSGVIDVGTLTDAAGYGPALMAVASTDDDLAAEVLAAGASGGEDGARLPLVPSYVELMRSPVADLVNGTIHIPDSSVLAATYLRQFAGSTPWVHLDIGSTAWLTDDWGGFAKGPTGVPLRTLLRLLEARSATEVAS
ncbi:MAG: M17 family peptidase N-terminal domain-containing protein [Actinomycetes bacterium]